MIVVQVIPKHSPQMSFIQDDHVIQALLVPSIYSSGLSLMQLGDICILSPHTNMGGRLEPEGGFHKITGRDIV